MSAGNDVFGDRAAAGPPQPFFHSRWVPAPAHVRDLGPAPACPPASARRASPAGSSRSGNPDLGLLVCDSEHPVSAARFTATGTPAAPVLSARSAAGSMPARGARQLRLRQRRHRRARPRRRRQDAGRRGARRGGVEPEAVALASTGASASICRSTQVLKGILAVPARAAPRGRRRLPAGDPDDRRLREARRLEVELSDGTVRLSAQCKGAGMISPNFATMLCFVQTDAALEPAHRRPAARRVRQALLRPLLGRRPAVHQRHRDPDVLGRVRRADRARERGRAALRRGARRAAAPARDHDGHRRRGRRADRARDRARRRSRSASRRPRARSPTRRWSRPRCTAPTPTGAGIVQAVGAALPRDRARSRGHRDRGHPRLLGGRRDPLRRGRAGAGACRRDEVEYEITLPGEGAETEVFFSDLSHEYVTINAEYTT